MNPSIFDRYPEVTGKPREMAMLCPLLLDRGLHADALALGEAAIAAAPESLAVQARVRGALSRRVPAYHRPMLLDRAQPTGSPLPTVAWSAPARPCSGRRGERQPGQGHPAQRSLVVR